VSTVVVFLIGGFTYEEAAAVHQLNASLGLQVRNVPPGSRRLVGSVCLIRNSIFLLKMIFFIEQQCSFPLKFVKFVHADP